MTAIKRMVVHFSAGLDTSYSQKSPDTISMSFIWITNGETAMYLMKGVQQRRSGTPWLLRITVHNFIDSSIATESEWGFARDTFIDSADQATINGVLKIQALEWQRLQFQ